MGICASEGKVRRGRSNEWPLQLCQLAAVSLAGSSTGAVPATIQPTSGFGETPGTCVGMRAPPGEQLHGTRNVGLGAARLKEELGGVLV